MKREGAVKETWTMPEWMEPYRELFQNTGGNSIESLMNDHTTNGFNNSIRSALIISVDAQITLLHRMRHHGMLKEVEVPAPNDQKGPSE